LPSSLALFCCVGVNAPVAKITPLQLLLQPRQLQLQ
jgi:hypothetical protein